jgi:hypothetical protein
MPALGTVSHDMPLKPIVSGLSLGVTIKIKDLDIIFRRLSSEFPFAKALGRFKCPPCAAENAESLLRSECLKKNAF